MSFKWLLLGISRFPYTQKSWWLQHSQSCSFWRIFLWPLGAVRIIFEILYIIQCSPVLNKHRSSPTGLRGLSFSKPGSISMYDRPTLHFAFQNWLKRRSQEIEAPWDVVHSAPATAWFQGAIPPAKQGRMILLHTTVRFTTQDGDFWGTSDLSALECKAWNHVYLLI